ncbi:MAG: thioredoxin family protein [Synechococcaceae cyanobacterium SM2_3_1]|nr:thioredoxin family protein [Synechococcaceae cyanobacterium SM2_3_1]
MTGRSQRRRTFLMASGGLASFLVGMGSLQQSRAAEMGKRMPEFAGIDTWLNSEPLTMKGLRGQVVGVQFWTFGCINCQRTLPHITSLYDTYADQGFVLVGVHTPEFPHERDLGNIEKAMQKWQIRYPVAVDNQFRTWRAYNNRYWPHLFLADRSGILRFDHIGEGRYGDIQRAVELLLQLNSAPQG